MPKPSLETWIARHEQIHKFLIHIGEPTTKNKARPSPPPPKSRCSVRSWKGQFVIWRRNVAHWKLNAVAGDTHPPRSVVEHCGPVMCCPCCNGSGQIIWDGESKEAVPEGVDCCQLQDYPEAHDMPRDRLPVASMIYPTWLQILDQWS